VQESNWGNRWRSVEEIPPDCGVFVELSRDADAKEGFDKVYWIPANWKSDGLFWRWATPPTFIAGSPAIDRPPIDEDWWYIVLVEPNQELPTVWRLHEQGKELYVPMIRRRIPTGRVGKNGHKLTRVHPRSMFPGYGLIRCTGIESVEDLKSVRGFREVIRDENRKPLVLSHEAVLAIWRKQSDKHHEFHQEYTRRNRPKFKPKDTVRVAAEGNVYDGLLATVEKDDGKGRIAVLLGMAKLRHTLPADMVVAA
jgi:transcription antitermination factor NusG